MKIRIGFALACLLSLSAQGHADTVYLKSNARGNTGKVLEEYPDSIVIKFPKSEIKRIEADEKPPFKEVSAQQVIWIDDGNTITLRLPKQSVQISGSSALPTAGNAPESAGQKNSLNPLEAPQELSNLSQGLAIQGKVLLKGQPLAKCKIRILRIMDSTGDRLLRLLSGSAAEKEAQSFEAVSDEHGIYTFTRIPYGEYILYWQPEGQVEWIRRLSENPDITLIPGHPAAMRDIEANVKTVN
jgi:hypothetical protein